MKIIFANPGDTIQLTLAIVDKLGKRRNSNSLPIISRIILPNFNLAAGYPHPMINIDTGLYYYRFVAPTGNNANGTYLIDVEYENEGNKIVDLYEVIIGSFSSQKPTNYTVSAG